MALVIRRAYTLAPAPGPKGTTTHTGLAGVAWEWACIEKARKTPTIITWRYRTAPTSVPRLGLLYLRRNSLNLLGRQSEFLEHFRLVLPQ